MTTPETEPREAAFFSTIRSWGIVRGPEGVLGGVISGLGARVGLAPWPARIIVILAAFLLFPIVILGYAAGWALLPDSKGNIVVQNFGRGVMQVGPLIGIVILTLIGFSSFGQPWFITVRTDAPFDASRPVQVIAILLAVLIPLAILGGIVGLVVWAVRRGSEAPAGENAVYAAMPERSHDASPAGAPAGAAASGAAASAVTARPVPPVPPRVPGPGRGFYLATLAWALISATIIAWCAREELLAIYPVLAWGMLFLTGLGAILIAVSLSGRRVGFLGFLGFLGLFPAVILMAVHDDLLSAYERSRNAGEAIQEIALEEHVIDRLEIDATSLFEDDYALIYLGGDCTIAPRTERSFEGTTARITIPDPMPEALEYDIVAATTTLVVPQGTSLKVVSDGDAQATVFFEQRALECVFAGHEGTYIELTQPGEPVLTLNVIDDYTVNTIVVEEKS